MQFVAKIYDYFNKLLNEHGNGGNGGVLYKNGLFKK